MFRHPVLFVVLAGAAIACGGCGRDHRGRFAPITSVFAPAGHTVLAGTRAAAIDAIAVAPDGRIYAADRDRREVIEFRRTGSVVRYIGGPGRKPGRFGAPWALACGAGGDVFVLDPQLSRVSEFRSSGSLRRSFTFAVLGISGLALAVHSDRVYVGGTERFKPGTPTVFAFARSGALRASFFPITAAASRLRIQLAGPVSLAVSGRGTIYAVQPSVPGVSIFSRQGAPEARIAGTPPFFRPAVRFPASLPAGSSGLRGLLARWTEQEGVFALGGGRVIALYWIHRPRQYALLVYGPDRRPLAPPVETNLLPAAVDAGGRAYLYNPRARGPVVLTAYRLRTAYGGAR